MTREEALESKFLRAYIEAALFSTTDNADDSGGEPLDKNYDEDDLTDEAVLRMSEDCLKFQADSRWGNVSGAFKGQGSEEEQGGFDFWMTRNGHGVGFWDGDWKEPHATALTELSKEFGEQDIYVGDDGTISIG